MHVAVVGGGPGGLFLATLLRQADPRIGVTVFERNRADDTFGFGVVLSNRALADIHDADPVLREGLGQHGQHWDIIDIRLKGERLRCGGNGMTAIARPTLLHLLQTRAQDAGAQVHFSTDVNLAELDDYDLVVAADGANSRMRTHVEGQLDTTVETAQAKFIWFGTDYLFDGLTFLHQRSPHGVFSVHGYPISAHSSTFIVETNEATWRAAGLDEFDVTQPAGPSDETSKQYLEKLFADQIDGHQLLVNNSRWGNFRTRRTRHWHTLTPRPMALLGDAVHTAHFSVGSGTKMAMDDAIALARALTQHPQDLATALPAYEVAAQPSVAAIQNSARPSLSWWEHVACYYDAFEPWQFAYHFLTRSITDARLARRDAAFVTSTHHTWAHQHGGEPLESPLTVAGWALPQRRLAVSNSRTTPPDGGQPLSLHAQPPPEPASRWGATVCAPESEEDLPGVFATVDTLVAAGPDLVAVHGGSALTRRLVCEHARLRHRVPTLLIEEDSDRDQAVTAVLSGRTDLVGASPTVVAQWGPA